MEVYDVVVVGLGAMGSSCVYHLARRGVCVLGIEQFDIANDLGSSGGRTRQAKIVPYVGTPYEPFIRRSYELWEQLERESEQTVLTRTGWIDLKPNDAVQLYPGAFACELLDPAEIERKYPRFDVPANYTGVYDPAGGVIHAESAIASACRLALENGAELRGREKVLRWEDGVREVRIETTKGRFKGKHIVFCCGAWTSKLVDRLPRKLEVCRLALGWVWPDDPDGFMVGSMPIWELDGFYGFPMLPDYPGFKLARHWHGRPADPEVIDRTPNAEDERELRRFLQQRIPSADGPSTCIKVCMYTHGGPIVSRHPEYRRVSVAAAFGGGGFKFAPAYGELLAELALGREPTLPSEFLSL